MRKILLLCALFFLGNSIHAQNEEVSNSIDVLESNPSTWQSYYSNEKISIEYKFENCDPEMGYDKELVIFKVINKTSSKIEVSWRSLQSYNGKCKTCDYEDEYTFYTVLSPEETKIGSCSVYSENYQLKIFSKFTDTNSTNTEALTSFELENLVVVEHSITE